MLICCVSRKLMSTGDLRQALDSYTFRGAGTDAYVNIAHVRNSYKHERGARDEARRTRKSAPKRQLRGRICACALPIQEEGPLGTISVRFYSSFGLQSSQSSYNIMYAWHSGEMEECSHLLIYILRQNRCKKIYFLPVQLNHYIY